jgi:Ca2+-binding EF-hand superfamily protein
MRHTYQELVMKKLVIGLLAVVSVSAMAQDRVSKFDKNGDAKVDFAELSTSCEISKGLFERADKNGDGVLSNSEMRTAKGYLFSRCKSEEKNA